MKPNSKQISPYAFLHIPRPFKRGSIWWLCLCALWLAGCATNKDRFINRQWHSLNSKYNVLFNGEMAFESAWIGLQNGYQENFWEPLPIERFVPSEFASFSNGPVADSPFSLAEEKAVKAVKTHGMTIEGEEHNAQMIHAYSLLGRARYFDQRFVPALEAFNYIIRRYPASNKLNELRIWKEKTNLRLGNEAIALENIKRLLKFRKLKGQSLANAHAVSAQAYLSLNAIDSAAWDLKKSLKHSKVFIEKARYGYILGQLFQAQKKEDSALWAYETVVDLNRRIPRIFLIQAQLQTLFLKATAGNSDQEAILALTKMEENWENKAFLDRIYYEKAQLFRARRQDSNAVAYAQKSLKIAKTDLKRNAENYRLIAAIYFEKGAYSKSEVYYDSLSQNLKESSIEQRITLNKIKSLKDLVFFEKQAQLSDSLLKIAALSPSDQFIFIRNLITKEKKKDSLGLLVNRGLPNIEDTGDRAGFQNIAAYQYNSSIETAEALKQKKVNPAASEGVNLQSNQYLDRKSTFYFYNTQAAENGMLAFRAQWGDRALEDNWRWIIAPQASETKAKGVKLAGLVTGNLTPGLGGRGGLAIETLEIKKTPINWEERLSIYLAGVPKTQTVLSALTKSGEQAYYQLGRLFADEFNRPDLTQNKLETLLNKPPLTSVKLPATYALFKAYEAQDNNKAQLLRTLILRDYPESDYAKAIINPAAFYDRQKLLEQRYDSLYQQYTKQDFSAVMVGTTQLLADLLEDPKGAPTALLRANTVGRLYGFAAYKSALISLTTQYPKTSVAISAQNSLSAFEENPPTTTFGKQADRDRWYLALLYSDQNDSLANQAYLNKLIEKFPAYKIQREVYAPNKTFYVITGFKDKDAAQMLKEDQFFKEERLDNQEFFVVLRSHYKTLQLFKSLEGYKKHQEAATGQSLKPK